MGIAARIAAIIGCLMCIAPASTMAGDARDALQGLKRIELKVASFSQGDSGCELDDLVLQTSAVAAIPTSRLRIDATAPDFLTVLVRVFGSRQGEGRPTVCFIAVDAAVFARADLTVRSTGKTIGDASNTLVWGYKLVGVSDADKVRVEAGRLADTVMKQFVADWSKRNP